MGHSGPCLYITHCHNSPKIFTASSSLHSVLTSSSANLIVRLRLESDAPHYLEQWAKGKNLLERIFGLSQSQKISSTDLFGDIPSSVLSINLFPSFNNCRIYCNRKNKSGSSTKKPSRNPNAGLSSKTQEFEILCHICRRVRSSPFQPFRDHRYTKSSCDRLFARGISNLGCHCVVSVLTFHTRSLSLEVPRPRRLFFSMSRSITRRTRLMSAFRPRSINRKKL